MHKEYPQCTVLRNYVSMGKIVIFDNQKEVQKVKHSEFNDLFDKMNNHTIDEYLRYREMKTILADTSDVIFHLLDFVFFTFDTESVNFRFRELVIDHKMNFSEAIEVALEEFFKSDQMVFPKKFTEDKEIIEEYFKELIGRLKIRYEMVMLERFIEHVEGDFILLVDVFKKEYFNNIKINFRGMICKNIKNVELARTLSHEFEVPIAIHHHNFIEGDLVIIDGINKKIIENPEIEKIDSYNAIIHSKTYFIGEDPSYPKSKINLYAPMVDTRFTERVAHSNWYAGVAPYKTEYMYVTNGVQLTLEQQYEIFLKFMRDIGDKEIYIRIPDFRPERPTEFFGNGFTDIETHIEFEPFFDDNLRAIALASKVYNRQVNIIIPMIRIPDEIEYWRRQVHGAFSVCGIDNVKVGIMIETESAFEYFEDYKTMDFAVIGLNDLIEEISDDYNRFSNLTKEQMLNVFWPNLRDLHQFLRTFKMQTKHIVAGNMLNNPHIVRKLIKAGFTDFSIQLSQVKLIEHVIKEYVDTRGTFIGVAAQRIVDRDQRELDQFDKEREITERARIKAELKGLKKEQKAQAIRDLHKDKRDEVIKMLLSKKDDEENDK